MLDKIIQNKTWILGIVMVTLVLCLSLATVTPVAAAAKDEVCKGLGLTGGNCTGGGAGTINNLVADVVSILSWVVGIAAVVMIMVGGFKYVTSQGDSNAINSAKNTILYAIIGLIIALFAQMIVRFVINRV